MGASEKTFAAYVAVLDDEKRTALEKLRAIIAKLAPDAEETFSYGLPAFKLNGKPLVALGATKNHCAFYPMSESIVAQFSEELSKFETSKGTIRFQPSKPIPVALIKEMVKARIAENAVLLAAKSSKKK